MSEEKKQELKEYQKRKYQKAILHLRLRLNFLKHF